LASTTLVFDIKYSRLDSTFRIICARYKLKHIPHICYQ
jgi:hypothetical protein